MKQTPLCSCGESFWGELNAIWPSALDTSEQVYQDVGRHRSHAAGVLVATGLRELWQWDVKENEWRFKHLGRKVIFQRTTCQIDSRLDVGNGATPEHAGVTSYLSCGY
jgi:hypothetical protein